MNMFDEARAIRTMMDMRDVSQGEMAKSLGVSQSYIANKMRLLNFDKSVEEKIIESKISERHARAILRLGNSRRQLDAIEKIIERELSVAETESLVDFLYFQETPTKLKTLNKTKATDEFQKNITESIKSLTALGVSVKETKSYYKSKTYITICIEE